MIMFNGIPQRENFIEYKKYTAWSVFADEPLDKKHTDDEDIKNLGVLSSESDKTLTALEEILYKRHLILETKCDAVNDMILGSPIWKSIDLKIGELITENKKMGFDSGIVRKFITAARKEIFDDDDEECHKYVCVNIDADINNEGACHIGIGFETEDGRNGITFHVPFRSAFDEMTGHIDGSYIITCISADKDGRMYPDSRDSFCGKYMSLVPSKFKPIIKDFIHNHKVAEETWQNCGLVSLNESKVGLSLVDICDGISNDIYNRRKTPSKCPLDTRGNIIPVETENTKFSMYYPGDDYMYSNQYSYNSRFFDEIRDMEEYQKSVPGF